MAVSRALRRLLRIRDLEEEQSRLALESALGELNRLQDALKATVERERRGRRLVESSARTGELPDRLAGLEEARAADRLFAVLGPRIAAKEEEVTARRQEFLLKRVERRQAETLIQESEAQEAVEADRRGQQALDNWYGSRQYREGADTERATLAAAALESQTPDTFETPAGHNSWVSDET
jgi:hypothetical protein